MKIHLLIGFLSLTLTGCSTYETLDPESINSNGKVVDQTRGEYGQPYYLPKALIHLTISATGTTVSTGAAPTGTTPNVTVNVGDQGTKPAATDQKKDSDPNGFAPTAYKITVDTQYVPDMKAGPYYAKYDQNWFAAENVNLAVTPDGLLSTVATTSSDRSIQVLDNVLDTVSNVAQFASIMGKTSTGIKKKVRYEKLDIDVIFDSTDPKQRDNILKLVNGHLHTIPDSDGTNVTLIPPLRMKIVDRFSQGKQQLSCKQAGPDGLWFREGAPIELQFEQNQEEFRTALLNIVNETEAASKPQTPSSDDADSLKTAKDNASKKIFDAQNEKPPDANKIAAAKAAYLKAQAEYTAAQGSAPADTGDWVTDARKSLITSTTTSRTAVFVKLVPNPNRVFAFNIARSAFVQNKQTNLAITSGMLTGVNINKGSEIEGFSTIPLEITKRLVEIPNDILTIRTQNVTSKKSLADAEKGQFDSQNALSTDVATQAQQQQQAILGAQNSVLNAQNTLQQTKLSAQTASLNAQATVAQAQANADTAQTNAEAAKIAADTAKINAETAQAQATLNLLQAQQAVKKAQGQ